MSDNCTDIKCKIIEQENFNINFEEEIIQVKVDQICTCGSGGGGVTPAEVVSIINDYLLLEDLTSQIDGVKTTFLLSNPAYKVYGIWINGLKERGYIMIDNEHIQITPAIQSGDSLEIQYLKVS